MDIDLEKKLNKKPIKDFTEDDWKEYRHRRYERDREKRLQYQKEYHQKHKFEIQKKARNRYRIKCGLRLEK